MEDRDLFDRIFFPLPPEKSSIASRLGFSIYWIAFGICVLLIGIGAYAAIFENSGMDMEGALVLAIFIAVIFIPARFILYILANC